ncbi:hypothetical protein LKD27_04095 [Faecalibacterium sp. CLA-AA-H283]|nr:hypothetical protein [Faecalibacterium hominis (ex Afrizal et al. 2022)]
MTAFLLPFCPLDLENRMTVCMGYPAMTPQWESRKTPPEGGRKAMQGERQDVDFPVTVKNDVVKLATSLFRDANERMKCL